jgi:hypothetical protein
MMIRDNCLHTVDFSDENVNKTVYSVQ